MQTLRGKTALITGAAKRLGAALARALADAGAHVVIHCRNSRDAADKLANAIMDARGAASVIEADLADTAMADSLVGRAIALAGPLDILINSASIFHEASFLEMEPAVIHENMNVNAIAPMLVARRFAAQQRPGAIINLLDTMVMDYDKKHVPYHLSKRVLHTLTRIMALEFAPDIRVNAIAPGLILPPPGKDNTYLESLAHTNPLHKHGSAAAVTDAALYLLHADFVTGQTLYVDGGRHLRGSMYE
ncbi:MAG TPA: SDR family oxidoreductase [Candidatus Hydrogenedentes bacterium]|nr:SDR family oxidoreductase [Candidatus Hydrogenedentota bacterium]